MNPTHPNTPKPAGPPPRPADPARTAPAAHHTQALADAIRTAPDGATVADLAHIGWGYAGVHEQVTQFVYALRAYVDYALDQDDLALILDHAYDHAEHCRPACHEIAEAIAPLAPLPRRVTSAAPDALFELGERIGERTGPSDLPAEAAAMADQVFGPGGVLDHLIACSDAILARCHEYRLTALTAALTDVDTHTRELAAMLRDIPADIRACPAPQPRWPYE